MNEPMAGPHKQFDHDKALKRALETFWAKGYEATSMGDLVDKMGVNRASLYDTFGNKRALFNQALHWYGEHSLQVVRQVLHTPGSPMAAVERLITLPLTDNQTAPQYGCFLNNTAVELGPHDPELAEKIRYFWQALEAELKITFDRAVAADELRTDTDTQWLANLCNTLMQGIAVKLKAQVSPAEIDALLQQFFKSIRK